MGLSGAKNKRKIGDDPNNTRWARNTDGFGHKLLRAQGWEPGQYLGQKDAAHAEFHTAASASYIRTVLREDNLGIGAAPSGGGTADECTGLDMFKDLLGRLNGESEAVIEQKQQARANVKMSLYVQRKYGMMRFVRGGLLVGDSMKEETETEKEADSAPADEATASASATTSDDDKAARKREKKAKKERKEKERREKEEKKEKKEKSKKRKAAEDDDQDEDSSQQDKKSKRRRKHETEAAAEAGVAGEEPEPDKKEKKSRKEKHRSEKERSEKKDKKARKEEKKRRKAAALAGESTETTDQERAETDSATPSESEKPAASAAFVSGRHLARRRYIAQKRAAIMDPQALRQIFMIKA